MGIKEVIHIFENSRISSVNYTAEALTAAYVETLAALNEVEQYRAIGTVEECRAAVEKQGMRAES